MQCYLCATPSQFFIRKNGYDLYRCPKCSLTQTNLDKPYDQFLKEFYTAGYYTGETQAGAYENYGKDKPYIVKNMESFLSHLAALKKKGTLLDVGCAYGYFVELAAHHGFDAYGVDPSAHAVSRASVGIHKRVREGTLADGFYKKDSFDVVTMFDVFEHLADPIVDLKKCHTLLKKDGVLMIATGDTDSLAAKILKRRWTFYIPPQHLFFFNKQTITETLKKAGFEPLSFFRIGKWLSLSYVLHLARTSGESGVASILLNSIEALHVGSFPLYLPMGDNMVVIARKIRSKTLV